MPISHRHSAHFVCQSMLSAAALGVISLTIPAALTAQSVPPAWDREFGTIDFLTLLDLKMVSASARNRFLAPLTQ